MKKKLRESERLKEIIGDMYELLLNEYWEIKPKELIIKLSQLEGRIERLENGSPKDSRTIG